MVRETRSPDVVVEEVDHHGTDLEPNQKKHFRAKFAAGWERVPNTARLCITNLNLHGINADPSHLEAF